MDTSTLATPTPDGQCLDADALVEFVQGTRDLDALSDDLKHLVRCPQCSAMLKVLVELSAFAPEFREVMGR